MMTNSKKKRLRRKAKFARRLLAAAPAEQAASLAAEPISTPSPGGQGETTRGELVLERTALRRPHLYGLDQEKREGLGTKNLMLAIGKNTEPRVVVSATRNLLLMEKQEQELQKREWEQENRKGMVLQSAADVSATGPGGPPLDGKTTQIIQNVLIAVQTIPEAREAVAEQLRLAALALRQQAKEVANGNGCTTSA
jgi:hypothetical protein